MPLVIQRQIPSTGLSAALLQRVVQYTRKHTAAPRSFALAYVIVDQTEIKRLNRVYRHIAEVTDVLSFGYDDKTGDVVLCYPQIVQQAQLKQIPLRQECAWVAIHGFLHVLGYDHERPTDAKTMRALEQTILADVV